MVDAGREGRGVGRMPARHVVEWAQTAGYHGVQFNAVVETNHGAVHLSQALGFEIVGAVPEALDHAEHGLVGLHVMFRRALTARRQHEGHTSVTAWQRNPRAPSGKCPGPDERNSECDVPSQASP
jgi:hypothetical protein